MNATELFQAGKLQDAIAAQVGEVKANPADQGKRMFLFELLVFAGDLDRATRQIDAVRYDAPDIDAAVATYRQLLEAERARRRLFSEGLAPHFFADQPDDIHLRLEAINRLREKKPAEAAEILNKAASIVPELKGQLNGKSFSSLRDCDDLFGGVLEVMAHGTYYWVPLDQVAAVVINPPRFPRDLIWVPARLEMAEQAGNVYLPALYAGSHEHPDDQVKLGRATDWKTIEGGPVLGVGLRTFLVGEDAVSLLEWRELHIGE